MMQGTVRKLGFVAFLAGLFIVCVILRDGREAGTQTLNTTAQAKDKKDDESCKKCSLKSLKGCYGYSYTGTSGSGPIAAVGPINFDGDGNTSATYSVNSSGMNFQGSFTGTYTVNEDCTGAVTIHLPLLGISSNGRFVIVEEGKEALFMGTDAGVTVTGVARKL
jgi:hypothetical protein